MKANFRIDLNSGRHLVLVLILAVLVVPAEIVIVIAATAYFL